jgi:HD-like signal output (HDOD) protein
VASTAVQPARDPAIAPAGETTSAGLAPGTVLDEGALEATLSPQERVRFFCWLVDTAARPDPDPPAAFIASLLDQLDQVIGSETLRAALLPRAPHVVPQLMKTLRDERYSSTDVAARISKDVMLTAEVVRSATGVLQRGRDDGAEEGEIDLARAVAMIGTQGLRRAIASVVLRPIFDARGDSLSARAATRIWKDADKKARLCAALATQLSLDPFDGYLAGLLHNSGWTAALRAIDGLPILAVDAADLAHAEVVPQLRQRRDTLFGALVGPWNLSPAMNELAAEVGRAGLDAAASPLGAALRGAERLAALHALAPPGQRPTADVPMWALLPKPVQDCYAALARA